MSAPADRSRAAAPSRPSFEASSGEDFTDALLERLRGRAPAALRYRVEAEVGRGGMGAVLRVWDEDLRRPLAMKVLPEGEVERARLARFLEEAQVTGQLDHPGIVPVHELGVDAEGRVYFTMKLVEGRTLGAVFDELRRGEGGWTTASVLGLLQRVCEAMAFAHSRGVIHRDLKPANVMVGRFGEVLVMDWGLAKILGREDERDARVLSDRSEHAEGASGSSLYTMDGDVLGTPAYMPPEQAQGRIAEMGPASDVYAVGAMLYHLLGGRAPYAPAQGRLGGLALLRRVQEGPPRPLAELAPDAPPELAAICEKAMARDPAARYADMGALREDLAAFVEGRVVRTFEGGAWIEAKKWVLRNRALAGALGVALLLLVAGLGTALVLRARAVDNLELAERRGNRIRAQLAGFRLDEMRSRADALWPPLPGFLVDGRRWLDDLGDLDAEIAALRAAELEGGEQDLERLAAEQAALAREQTDAAAIPPGKGWSVARRLRFAEEIEERSVAGERARALWAEAIASIADPDECPDYGGLRVAPQLGLLPVGRDPDSGLWEFAHLMTGEPPERVGGRLAPSEQSALVLVLIPGGSFAMGARSEPPGAPGYEPGGANPDEGPVRIVVLDPFFLSKYEMTQGQWSRVTGRNPSTYRPDANQGEARVSLLSPVESLSWEDGATWLARMDLALPTEAQWEYAARAGSTTPWWTGPEPESLRGAANLADESLRPSMPASPDGFVSWSDGWPVHAPVGRFRANRFGLHDVCGNVMEWCRDVHASYEIEPRPGDGLRVDERERSHVLRGGAFTGNVGYQRSACRVVSLPQAIQTDFGLRPARALDGEPER